MDELTQRVQDLPGEVFNRILNLVFTCQPGTYEVNANYKPPALLGVSSDTRLVFGTTYYSSSAFVFDDKELIGKWLNSIGPDHKTVMKEIHFVADPDCCPSLPVAVFQMLAPEIMMRRVHVKFRQSTKAMTAAGLYSRA